MQLLKLLGDCCCRCCRSHRAQLFLQKEVTLRPAGTEGRAGPGSYNTLRCECRGALARAKCTAA